MRMRSVLRTSLTLARQTGDRLEIGFEVQGVAMSLAGLGQPDLAGWEAQLKPSSNGSALGPARRASGSALRSTFGAARQALGPADAARAWAAGRASPFDRQWNRRSRWRREYKSTPGWERV